MRHRKRFFITKSDLLFAALLALAIWLGICWHIGSGKYGLSCLLAEEIHVSGIVRTTQPSLPKLKFAYPAGSTVGPCYYSDDVCPSPQEYELTFRRSSTQWNYQSREWHQVQDRESDDIINLSVELPVGWRAEPPDYTISGPRSDADFDLIRETQ